MTVTAIMGIPAVVPLLPLLPSLLGLCVWLVLALIPALAALRHPEKLRLLLRLFWRQKIGLTVLGSVAVCIAILVTPKSASEDYQQGGLPARPNRDWPEYRGGIARTGSLPRSSGPASAGTLWTGGTGYTFYSSPAVDGDRVYCCGFKGNLGRIFCWSADSGELLWTVAPSDFQATVSSPVLIGDLLLIGEGLHSTTQGRVVALDLRAGHEGETVWQFTTNGHVESTPTVRDGHVYAAAGDDGLYCLELSRDVAAEDRLVWHGSGRQFTDAETSLPLFDGHVFAGLGRDGNAMCRLQADTGKELSRQATPHPVFSAPAISNGRLVFGMGEGDYRNSGSGPGQVWCLDAATLEAIWKFEPESSVLNAVSIRDDTVYFGTGEGLVFGLDLADGAVLAKYSVSSPVVTAPAVTTRYVFVVSENGVVFCLDARSLELIWKLRLPDAGLCFSSPVVAGDRLFVGTSGGFFALGTDDVEASVP